MLEYRIYKIVPSCFNILFHPPTLNFNFIATFILNLTWFLPLFNFGSFLSHCFFNISFISVSGTTQAASLSLRWVSFFNQEQGLSYFIYIRSYHFKMFFFLGYILFIQVLNYYSILSFKFSINCPHFNNCKYIFISLKQYADFWILINR